MAKAGRAEAKKVFYVLCLVADFGQGPALVFQHTVLQPPGADEPRLMLRLPTNQKPDNGRVSPESLLEEMLLAMRDMKPGVPPKYRVKDPVRVIFKQGKVEAEAVVFVVPVFPGDIRPRQEPGYRPILLKDLKQGVPPYVVGHSKAVYLGVPPEVWDQVPARLRELSQQPPKPA